MNQNKFQETSLFVFAVIALILLFLVLLAFAFGNALVRDHSRDKQIETLSDQVLVLQEKNQKLQKNREYIGSVQFKDRWQKEHNGLKRPGEKVIIIEEESDDSFLELENIEKEERILMEREMILSRPNREQWWILFFGDN